jgi:hypothetical protein
MPLAGVERAEPVGERSELLGDLGDGAGHAPSSPLRERLDVPAVVAQADVMRACGRCPSRCWSWGTDARHSAPPRARRMR